MKNLLSGITLIALMFFCSENTFAQNTPGGNLSTTKIKTPAETSSSQIPIETKLITSDGINA